MLRTKFPDETRAKISHFDVNIGEIQQDLSNKIVEGVLVLNEIGDIQRINPNITLMFGYEKQDLIGKNIKILLPEIKNLKEMFINDSPIDGFISEGGALNINGKHIDGFEFSVKLSGNRFKALGKNMMMILLSNQTVNKYKEFNIGFEKQIKDTDHDISQNKDLLDLITANFPNGVIGILDHDYNCVYLGGQEFESGGLQVGNSFLNLIESSQRKEIKNKLLGAFKGEKLSFEMTLDNKVFMVNAIGLPGRNKSHNQILVVTQNITHLKTTEKEILNSLEKEKRSNEMKSQFVSMATHEFRTPLTTILNSTSLLSKLVDIEGSEQGVQKQVDRIKSTISLLNNILNDCLSIGRIEEGKLDKVVSEINLPEFTSDVLEELQDISKPGQKIKYQHKGVRKAFINGDMLKNIYHNLISNAIKYSSENDTINIETSVVNKQLKLIVQDEGIGIPKEEQKHMFERFFRAGNVSRIKGTGLGLNIVKKYLEVVGGNIKFFSIVNKGTTFIVDIPVHNSSNDTLNFN